MDKLISLAYEIKDLLDNDVRVSLLSEKEKIMENDIEAMKLAYLKDLRETEYSDSLKHFSQNSEEVKKAQKELFLAKEKLDLHQSVKDYLRAYKTVRELYHSINYILFDELKTHLCEK